MLARTVPFEDIHEVAVRIAARKLRPSQNVAADRAGRRLFEILGARRPELRAQLRRIGYLDEAARLVGDDSFGFHLARDTNTKELGIIHYILSASDTAFDAIRNLVRYHHLVNTTTSLSFEEADHHASIETIFRPGLESFERQIAEWGTTVFVAEFRRLTNTEVSPQSITFVHRRNSGLKEFRDFFGCPIEFGASRQVAVFAKQDLVLPILSADRHLLNILEVFCEEAISRRKMPHTPARARVEKLLVEMLPKGKATVSSVAKSLAMSTRSLERRLNEEGTSYTAVLAELRRELAMQYLQDKTLGIGQIAWLLGYSEVSSFNHAFRRWTSKSPKAVRVGGKKS
jgi:AraC-like DNA-binding protein